MKNVFLTAYTNDERHTAINKVQELAARYGDIIDIRLFSDISITLTIEIASFKIQQLYQELQQNMTVDKIDNVSSTSQEERTMFLNVVFIKGTGDLRIEVPSVPG